VAEQVDSHSISSEVRSSRFVIGAGSFARFYFVFELLLVAFLSVATGIAYQWFIYNSTDSFLIFLQQGLILGALYCLPFLFRDEYEIDKNLDGFRDSERVWWLWNYAFFCLSVVGFLTKTTDFYSRGWLILLYFIGLGAMLSTAYLMPRLARAMVHASRLQSRRLMLLGMPKQCSEFAAKVPGGRDVNHSVEQFLLRDADSSADGQSDVTEETLRHAVAKARSAKIDDAIIVADGLSAEQLNRVVNAFLLLPLSVHIAAPDFADRFKRARIDQFGRATTISLVTPPLSSSALFAKRMLDVGAAALGLLLLLPVFAVVAIAIKLDSRGPVFFRQRRHGFRREEFRIWKFRTMTCLDDGDVIRQANKNDARVTRVGKWLRRCSIDELPQLINVLSGEMSLVGPRPHAVAHDEFYEPMVANYVARFKIRPGITGWAQVNGYRGNTEDRKDMDSRVSYDLYYIEHWSLGFDLAILIMTVISPKTYMNAQ